MATSEEDLSRAIYLLARSIGFHFAVGLSIKNKLLDRTHDTARAYAHYQMSNILVGCDYRIISRATDAYMAGYDEVMATAKGRRVRQGAGLP